MLQESSRDFLASRDTKGVFLHLLLHVSLLIAQSVIFLAMVMQCVNWIMA